MLSLVWYTNHLRLLAVAKETIHFTENKTTYSLRVGCYKDGPQDDEALVEKNPKNKHKTESSRCTENHEHIESYAARRTSLVFAVKVRFSRAPGPRNLVMHMCIDIVVMMMIAQRRKARRKTQPAYQMYIQSKHTYTTHIIDKRTNQHAGTMAAPQSKGHTPQHAQRKGRSLQQCHVGSVWCVAICVAGVTWVHETGRPSRWIATPGRDAWLHYVNERSVPVGLRETQRRRCRECCVYTYTHIAWHLLAHSTIAPSFNDEALRRGQTPASRNAASAFIIRHIHTHTHTKLNAAQFLQITMTISGHPPVRKTSLCVFVV